MKLFKCGLGDITLMVTKNQLGRGIRKSCLNYVHSPALLGNPQQRGRYIRTVVVTPRKPNSARRKVGKVRLSNGKVVLIKMHGSGSLPHKFAIVLVRGKGHRDTPGARYSAIRGVLECMPLYSKQRRRSLYGSPRPKKK